MPLNQKVRSQWASQLTFILAVIGSAVGLGNVWKFPYLAGEFGGGVFILVYILSVLLILPVMTGEILLGRRGRRSPVNTMRRLASDFSLSRHWKLLGWLGVGGGFLILSYYSVVAGWTIAYFFRASSGVFENMTTAEIGSIFDALIGDAEKMLAWHTLFILMTVAVVANGIKLGIERVTSYSIPLFFALLVFLLVYVILNGAFKESVQFMFTFNWENLTHQTVLYALGQAFFSVGIGLGAIMVYGSYLPNDIRIVSTTAVIVIMDTVVAIVAGLVVFALVFQHGLSPGQGPGLVFKTLPLAFGSMPAGSLIGAVFFALLFLAAWTSAISLVEPAVAWLCETRNYSRMTAAWLVGSIAWLLGLGTIFSFTDTAAWSFQGVSLYDFLEYLTANVMLPLGGAFIAIFSGWKLPAVVLREELNILHPLFYRLWRFMLRYACPAAIFLVLANQIIDFT